MTATIGFVNTPSFKDRGTSEAGYFGSRVMCTTAIAIAIYLVIPVSAPVA